MAMRQSQELSDVLSVLFQQFDILGIRPTFAHLTLFDEANDTFSFRMTGLSGERILFEQVIDVNEMEAWKTAYEDWKKGEEGSVVCIDYPAEVLPAVFDAFSEIFAALPEDSKMRIEDFPEGIFTTQGHCRFGYLGFEHTRRATDDEKTIVARFAREFGLVYQRFLELQKAEQQTREAQIEAALERVRTASMAMQKTQDISDVVVVFFNQLKELELPFVQSWINVFHLDEGYFDIWFSPLDGIYDEPAHFQMPSALFEDTSIKSWRAGEAFSYVNFNSREEVDGLMQVCDEVTGSTYFTHSQELLKLERLNFLDANYKYGTVSRSDRVKAGREDEDILARFAKVFEQTYTRFLDIQKAEKLALETSRQASLARVRAEIASMRSADDLQQITPVVWNELKILDIPFIRCGVFIIDEDGGVSQTYLSTADGDSIAVLRLPLEGIPLVEHARASWVEKEIYTEHWEREDFEEWTQNLIERGHIDSKERYEAGSVPETLDLHLLPFKQGMLYIGNTEPLSEESLDLGQSLADAFSVAYDRYEDFTRLEQAKQKIEEAFRELEAAKDQLVQQEKLASLGQLPAGIAHEIKNPLNFVNNFADFSLELVDEVREMVGEAVKTDDDLAATLDDLETNLRKIHEHGTRAYGIVKSMLQHSRGGSGEMEPTNLNILVKEYVSLAYHGMRAGPHPINVELELDLAEDVGEVVMIGEDFSRVILNLCNNAFDAMREKLDGASDAPSSGGPESSGEYEPMLAVRTRRRDGAVSVEIQDNGPGIPLEIRDQVLQPFFTTKKGTAGTGLGLSITDDIIKAHGGMLEIDSDSSGTTFLITLSG